VNGDTRLKALGPFLEFSCSTQGWQFAAARPFYSRVDNPAAGARRQEFFWPVGEARLRAPESNWRFLVWFGLDYDATNDLSRYRVRLFPFYFQGRDDRDETYHGVFPLGGSVHEFIGLDKIDFVLFPLHSTSAKDDLRTTNWLWPLISKTTGDGIYRARFFPFYGRSIKVGTYDKRFVLWPLWTQARYDDPRGLGYSWILFPLWGHTHLPDQETYWLLPPLFRYSHGDRGHVVFCPWPFYQKMHLVRQGQTVYRKLYFWPLWGQREIGNIHTTFALWPIVWNENATAGNRSQHRVQVVPFVDSVAVREAQGAATNVVERRFKFWPLLNYRREGDQARLRLPELWPFPDAGAVDRNWAPLWTLFERQARGDDVDVELLWGLYNARYRDGEAVHRSLFPLWRWSRDAETNASQWDVLMGLIGRSTEGSQSSWRLLYFFDLGDRETVP
jgi:hypothetical protein